MSQQDIILNVDDYDPGRYARTKVLRKAGFLVEEARTAEEAFRMVFEHKPTLILLDVNLPDMSGFEVCKRLRENPETKTATILHISASSIQSHHQVDGLEAGADAYIVEPVDPLVLIATIGAFLRARRAEEALRRKNAELEWFAHRAAHDLNDPLRSIGIHTELLQLGLVGKVDPNLETSLQFVADAAKRMRLLIDGLLRYAEHSAEGRPHSEFDTGAILDRVRGNLEASIRETGAKITQDKLPTVIADPGLEEVFQNLLANAMKYRRPTETPEVHVSAAPDGDNWRFSIRDNGIGIEPDDREAIFKIFTRLHGNDIPGSGIGLAVSQKIVAACGGQLWVESEPGVGSTFYFTIPKSS